MQIISTFIIPLTMFGLMFSMGLTLAKSDFKRVAVYPKASIAALIIQLMIAPLVGIAVAVAFDLGPMAAAGLVAVAACPGGTMSNVMVHLARADTALSITITALATSVTLITLPLWVNLALSLSEAGQTDISMPVLRTAAQLGVFTVLPVGLGMLAVAYKPSLKAIEPRLTAISSAAMIVAFVVMAFSDASTNFGGALTVFVPAVLLYLLLIIIGYGIPKAIGLDHEKSFTICIEIMLKNILLAIFIATNSLNNIEASFSSMVMMIVMLPGALLLTYWYKKAQAVSKAHLQS